ncbi:peptide chain release factor 3 [Methylobacter sp.]|uniref:peptide chain release factor 3 n=1 Tax=Methylobacter sp. TaxID=2051955 RepID=UPI00258B3532|nr:peptide chain release factor 3 [Methylobacter sp.]
MNQPLTREIRRRRTFAIISHPDAGKTTLTEKLLLFGGAIQAAGTVKARKSGRYAASDWMAVEQQRGISVSSSVMQFEYSGHVINLLDTPGHQDFSEDTYRVLTAVDAALMVIDAAKGVEAQTIRLLEVCRLRKTPIITFINKLDREVREPLELLDEIEQVLKIRCAPITWPVGMGKSFRGVFHLLRDEMHRFRPGEGYHHAEVEAIKGIDDPVLDAHYPMEIGPLRAEVDLVRGASEPFDHQAYLRGEQSPVFFGSAINNFGVRELLQSVIDWAPPPQPRDGGSREVGPLEPSFSGFVFKIQANMDPRHRDRIAFLRICSGRLTPEMRVTHVRIGRQFRISHPLTFMANERTALDEAVAGDVIGIHNHGQFQIGDTLTEGEPLAFKGIPYFAPELFMRARLKDPLKGKQLNNALKELGEEGAIQVFQLTQGGPPVLGAVGQLQFEIVSHRLQAEYGVPALFEPVNVRVARWVRAPNMSALREFEKGNPARLATDVDGNRVLLAESNAILQLITERWPDIELLTTREHGERLQANT